MNIQGAAPNVTDYLFTFAEEDIQGEFETVAVLMRQRTDLLNLPGTFGKKLVHFLRACFAN